MWVGSGDMQQRSACAQSEEPRPSLIVGIPDIFGFYPFIKPYSFRVTVEYLRILSGTPDTFSAYSRIRARARTHCARARSHCALLYIIGKERDYTYVASKPRLLPPSRAHVP